MHFLYELSDSGMVDRLNSYSKGPERNDIISDYLFFLENKIHGDVQRRDKESMFKTLGKIHEFLELVIRHKMTDYLPQILRDTCSETFLDIIKTTRTL